MNTNYTEFKVRDMLNDRIREKYEQDERYEDDLNMTIDLSKYISFQTCYMDNIPKIKDTVLFMNAGVGLMGKWMEKIGELSPDDKIFAVGVGLPNLLGF